MDILSVLRKNIRALKNARKQIVISVVCLSVALTCFIFTIYWFTYELNYDSFYPDSDRTYLINQQDRVNSSFMKVTPYPLAGKIKNEFPEVEIATVCQSLRPNILVNKEGMEFVRMNALKVDTNFFHIFPQRFLYGNIDDEFRAGNGIILCESFARKIFGTIKLKGHHDGLPLPISGVIADPPPNTALPFKLLIPWDLEDKNLQSWSSSSYLTFVLLQNFSSKNDFSKKLNNTFFNPQLEELNRVFNIVPLNRMKYMSEGQSFTLAYAFQIVIVIASTLLLFSAIFNFVILTISRFISRIKEYLLHKILGAKIWYIVFLQYIEIIFISLIAFGLSFILLELFQSLFFNFIDVQKNVYNLFFSAIIYTLFCLFAILIANLYPVYCITVSIIKKSLISSHSHAKYARLGTVLIGLQLFVAALSFFFILGVMHQFYYSTKSDLGFNQQNIERLELKSEVIKSYIQPFVNELKSNKIISNVIWCDYDLFGTNKISSFSAESFLGSEYSGSKKDDYIYYFPLMPEVFHFFQMSMINGRSYSNTEDEGMMEVMVNEELLHVFGLQDKDIVGQIKYWLGNPVKVVGVVKNIHNQSMKETIKPIVWINSSTAVAEYINSGINICYFKYQEGTKAEAIAFVRDTYQKYAPGASQPDIVSFTDYLISFYQQEKRTVIMFSIISIVSLFISVFGVYTLVSFRMRQRRKEIVVRKIMGASSIQIANMLFKEYLGLVLISCCIAIPIGYKWLEYWMQYSYHIVIGIPHVLIVLSVMIVIVVLTVMNQIFRLAYINPSIVIKENN